MHENAFVAKEVLETLRKPGGTKEFCSYSRIYSQRKWKKNSNKLQVNGRQLLKKVKDEESTFKSSCLFG